MHQRVAHCLLERAIEVVALQNPLQTVVEVVRRTAPTEPGRAILQDLHAGLLPPAFGRLGGRDLLHLPEETAIVGVHEESEEPGLIFRLQGRGEIPQVLVGEDVVLETYLTLRARGRISFLRPCLAQRSGKDNPS